MKNIFKWLLVPIVALVGGGLFKWLFSFFWNANCGFAVSELARTYTFGGHTLLVINYVWVVETATGCITAFLAMNVAPKYKLKVGYVFLILILILLLFSTIYANIRYNVKLEANVIMILGAICNVLGILLAIKYQKENQ